MSSAVRTAHPAIWVGFRLTLSSVGLLLFASVWIPLPSRQVGPVDAAEIVPDKGFAYRIQLSALSRHAIFTYEMLAASTVFEDGTALKRVDQHIRSMIRNEGQGRFTHWENGFVFATPDNTDPRTTRRHYVVETPLTLFEYLTSLAPGWTRPQATALALAVLLLYLPWSPVTYLSGEPRRRWLLLRTIPTCALVAGFLLLERLFRLNFIDVYSLMGRLFYVAVLVFLVLTFVIYSFWNWRTDRILGLREVVPAFPRLTSSAANLGFTVLLVLCALEVLARAFPLVSTSPANPGHRFYWSDDPQAYNSLGFDDAEPGKKQMPRILLIGDSYTQGVGVSKHERFSSRLAALTNGSLQVINAAKWGMDTFDEAEVLERIGDIIRPDVVVVGYVMNDAQGDELPGLSPADLFFLGTVKSYAYFRFLMCKWTNYCEVMAAQHREEHPGWQRVQRGLDKISRWCKDREVRCMLLVLPVFRSRGESLRSVMDKVAEEANRRGIPSRNMLDDFDRPLYELGVSWCDLHPNAIAHETIARKIYETIGPVQETYARRTPK